MTTKKSTKATKATKKPLTRRQAEIKGASLLRGIDNSVARIKKETASIANAAKEIKREVLPAIANDSTPKKEAPKKAEKAEKAEAKKPAAPKKKAPKAPAKKAAPKKAPAKKAAPKKAPAKKAAPKKKDPKGSSDQNGQSKKASKSERKPPVANRPTVKEACMEAIGAAGGNMDAANLYRTVCDKYGYWSRQSLYNALKDEKAFKKTKDGQFAVVASSKRSETTDAEADAFVEGVSKDSSVSAAI